MNLILDALLDLVVGGRTPRMDPVMAGLALVVGALTGVLMYSQMLQNGSLGLFAWLLIPMAATFIAATVLARPHGVRGAFLAAAVALIAGLPMAMLDLMFGF